MKSSEEKVIKNAFFYTISSITTLIISFISVTLLTYLLSPEEYGIVNFFSSTVSILTIILSVSISASISRFYYEKSSNYKEYIKSICFFIIIFNMILTPIFIIFSSQIAAFLNIEVKLFYLILLGCYANIFLEFYEKHLIASQNAKGHMIFKVVPLILNTLISIILIISLKNLNGGYIRVLTILCINILFLIYIICKARNLFKVKANKRNVKTALLFSIPLVLHSLSNYILTYFDKLIINQYGNLSSTGVYSLATKISEVLLLVINSINYSWAPVFYQNNGDYKSVEGILKKYSQLVFLMALGIIFYAENIAKILVASEFHSALSIIPVLVIGYIFVFLYQIYVNYAIYIKKTINITVNTIIAAIINIILNYIFIPKYGYQAACYTTLISYILLFIFHYINSKFILKGDVFKLKNIKNEFIYLIVGIIVYILTKMYCRSILLLLVIRTLYVIFLFIKFDVIKTIKNYLFKGDKNE